VLAIVAEDPRNGEQLPDAPGYLVAEVVHACRNEGADRLEDVLDRRLRTGLNLDEVTPELIRSVADIMASTLGWDADQARTAVLAVETASGRS
jgi:glycerol-3-phosphate dehydrogenase